MKSNPANRTLRWNNWERVVETYERLKREPLLRQKEILAHLKLEDPALFESVSLLLSGDEKSATFLNGEVFLSAAPDIALSLITQKPGDEFENFELGEELGRGQFGVVFEAVDTELGRSVALKITEDQGMEGRLMAQFEHPRIVRIYSQGRLAESGLRWCAMQRVMGTSLLEVLQESKTSSLSGFEVNRCLEKYASQFSWDLETVKMKERLLSLDCTEFLLHVGISVAEALQFAHGQGVLHLDIKPGNILINPAGQIFLTDFSVSKSVGADGAIRQPVGGTLKYMSPEQKASFDRVGNDAVVDARSDLFSLVVTLEELAKLETVPLDLRAIFDKARALNPKDRFSSLEEFRNILISYRQVYALSKNKNQSVIERKIAGSPLWALSLLGAVPQFLASLVGAAYNSVWILRIFSPEQKEVFFQTNAVMEPVLFTLAGGFWAVVCWNLSKASRSAKQSFSPKEGDRVRELILRLPFWGLGISFGSWAISYWILSSRVDIPGNLQWGWGGVFLLCFLISASYTFLIHQHLLLKYLYLRSWIGSLQMNLAARRELARISLSTRIAVGASLAIPNLSALFLLLGNAADSSFLLRALTSFLVAAGVVGVVLSLWLFQAIQKRVSELSA